MATDDERREIAARLRNVAEQTKLDAKIVDNPMTVEFVAAAVFYDLPYVRGLFSRLADLIEPSDGNAELCTRCDYCDYCNLPKCSEQDGYSFKPKGYTDLLVLADKTIASARHDMEVCGDTVPAWYAAGRLENIARGIREILGVSDVQR